MTAPTQGPVGMDEYCQLSAEHGAQRERIDSLLAENARLRDALAMCASMATLPASNQQAHAQSTDALVQNLMAIGKFARTSL